MAPEQLEGRPVDSRTDIFALGLVIYEMITGRRAFDKSSQAGVIAAILKEEPPLMSDVRPMTPKTVDRVVRACLAKAPDDRWQDARDLSRELTWLATGSGSPAALAATERDRSADAFALRGPADAFALRHSASALGRLMRPRVWLPAAGVVALATTVAWTIWYARRGPQYEATIRLNGIGEFDPDLFCGA